MDITFCSKVSCGKLSCERNQYNAPKNKDISIADLDNGCFGLAENPDKFYYCMYQNCRKKSCRFHLDRAPAGIAVEATSSLNNGCYEGLGKKRTELLMAICKGTQNTSHSCDEVCRAMCGQDGICHFCETIADAVEEIV